MAAGMLFIKPEAAMNTFYQYLLLTMTLGLTGVSVMYGIVQRVLQPASSLSLVSTSALIVAVAAIAILFLISCRNFANVLISRAQSSIA